MTEEKFIEILKDVWARELSADEAWEILRPWVIFMSLESK